MASGPRFFLQENGRRTGPHGLLVLKQKAEIQVVTPDTLHATESAPDDWSPLRDSQVLHDELFPARPRYTLDARRPIEHVNHPDNAQVPTIEEMLKGNLARQREAEGELLSPQPPRPNRRLRDYLIVAGLINGLVIINLVMGRPWYDPFLLGFFAMGNISLAWVLFGVMDRY